MVEVEVVAIGEALWLVDAFEIGVVDLYWANKVPARALVDNRRPENVNRVELRPVGATTYSGGDQNQQSFEF